MIRNQDYLITNVITGASWIGQMTGSGEWGIRVTRPSPSGSGVYAFGFQIDEWELYDGSYRFDVVS